MTAKFGTDLLKTQLKLMDSSLFQSFQALSPSTLNMEEAILFDSEELPTRKVPVVSSRTPSIAMMQLLPDFLLYLMFYQLQQQFPTRFEVCVCVYTYICVKNLRSLNL